MNATIGILRGNSTRGNDLIRTLGADEKKKIMKKNTTSKDMILEVIRNNRRNIRAFGVRKLGLFGSFVRQEQNEKSDIDFLVEFEKDKKTFDNFIQLSFLLEDSLNRRIELVTTESLSPYIGTHILEEVEYVTFSS